MPCPMHPTASSLARALPLALPLALLGVASLCSTARGAATAPILSLPVADADGLVHVPIDRRDVPASRLYAFHRREWYRRLVASTGGDAAPANATLPHVGSDLAPHHVQREALYSNPLRGSISAVGEYYVTLTFGGQPINVQLDTGSSTMAVPLSQCRNCRKGDHRLDLERATGPTSVITCSSNQCSAQSCTRQCGACSAISKACCSSQAPAACAFYLTYADRSGVSGALVKAEVGIASLVTPLVFGAILDETSSFENEYVDGIFGMAFKSLACNPSCVTPLFDVLVESGQVARDIFSICTGQEGGVLTLGGSKPSLYVGDLSYVPLVRTYTAPLFYLVSVGGVSLGGVDVKLPHFSSAIVDSGTTLVVVTTETYNALRDYFQSNYCNVPGLCPDSPKREIIVHPHYPHAGTGAGIATTAREVVAKEEVSDTWFRPGYCVNLSERELALLPTIGIKLDGYTLEVEPKVYMIPHYIKRGFGNVLYHCLGIESLKGLEAFSNDVIIGDTVLQKYFVEYDRESKRLGFAVATSCVDGDAVNPASLYEASGATDHGEGSGDGQWVARLREVIYFVVFVALMALVYRWVRKAAGASEGYQPIEAGS